MFRLVLLQILVQIVVSGSTGFAQPSTTIAQASDQLAYSNTLGTSVYDYGAGITVADDITITGSGGCLLSRFEFDVSGSVGGEGAGPFAVDFQLFDGCPGGVGQPIPGTAGHVSFGNVGQYTVAFSIPSDQQILIPRTVWLAVTFDRDHAGWVGGAPALVGYSDDWFYNPALGCEFSFGGYPGAPHSSMNARLFVRGDCPQVHAAYHAKVPRRGPLNPGEGVRMADDMTLDGPCQMIAYEVTVRGYSLYDTDLRLPGEGGLPGPIIPGTSRSTQPSSSFVQTLHQDFDPPVPLPQELWFTVAADSIIGRTQVSGLPARIGTSKSGYAVLNGQVWESRAFSNGLDGGAFEVTLLCAGPAAMGACCDMQYLDAEGEAVCRVVPRANCPYPAPGSDLSPAWREGDTCDADPFDPPCGTAACCRADGSCTNSTENFCEPRGVSWTRGSYCGSPDVACPRLCVLSEESCSQPRLTPGCINPYCCAQVCALPNQSFCCNVAWDAGCVAQAAAHCGLPPSNDECYAPGNGNGARLVSASTPGDADTLNATVSDSDPGYCCSGGGTGSRGVGTVWFRFVATSTTMRVRTCTSSAPAIDSLLQVFEAADSSSPQSACATLRSLGCNDDAAGCSSSGLNSQLCLRNLTVGKTYYAMVAAKREETRGLYRLTVNASCTDPVPAKCDCPTGPVQWIDPPSGVVDARRPHARSNAGALEGISSFVVEAPSGSDRKECWTLCETTIPAAPNSVVSSNYISPGRYSITLQRPISPGAVTTLTLNGDSASRGIFYSHPANVNGDSATGPADILDLIDALNGVRFLAWGLYSGDINRSQSLNPPDILELIDLLNGASSFSMWNGVPRPDPSPCLTAP